MSEEKKYVTNFTFPNGETYYVKDTEAREDIEELKKHGGGDAANAVLYTQQSLTLAQQEQVRENVGAGTYSKPSGGIPDSDIASAEAWNAKGTYSKPSGGIPASDLAPGVIPDVSGKANAADVYTKTEVDQKLVGAMDYKGTKATVSALPTSGNETGDVWHITADGSEWAWNGSAWEELGTAVDLSAYRTASAQDAIDAAKYTKPVSGIPKTDLAADVQTSLGKADTALQSAPVTSVNTKTGVVILSASDVGALPSSTSIPTKVSDLTNDSGYQTATQVQTAITNAAELPSGGTVGDFLRKTSSGVAWQTTPAAESNSFGGGA